MGKYPVRLLGLELLACIGAAAFAPAWAAGLYCRIDATPWLGCDTVGAAGAPCGCPATGGAAGHVRASGDEDAFPISSESTKLALGIASVDGPVVAFVPRALSSHRDEARTADQRQMLQIYDFFHFHNLATNQGGGGGEPLPAAPPPPAPTRGIAPVVPKAAPVTAAPHAAPLTPTRAFLRSADIPPPGVGAYGVVALKAKPTTASRERLGMLCQSFISSLPVQGDLPPSVSIGQQMVTIWPTDDPRALGPSANDCASLLSHYDLYGGQSAIQDAIAQGGKLSGRGPFLIGWSPSNSRHIRDAVVLVVDMSEFDTQASFDEAFLFWQRKVVEDPALWRSGFSVMAMRLAIRDFADRYGSDFIKAIHLGGD